MNLLIKIEKAVFFAAACVAICSGGCGRADEEISNIRMPADTIGYATNPAQVEAVVALADSTERPSYESNVRNFPMMASRHMVGAIFPHDDYLYAGQVYYHVVREVTAPIVVLIGVTHAARRVGIQDKLIFDRFSAWMGPYGACAVSSIREAVIESLPEELVLVSDEIHAAEHSLEALIPFLQYPYHHEGGYGSKVGLGGDGPEIIPILVSRLRGRLFEKAADTLAAVLHDEFAERGLELGKDVVILISADCVHYGDEKWGERYYAPFGVDSAGYDRAVEQDRDIIRSSLTGPLNRGGIGKFRERVERDDLQYPYKVTWCGVYSIPFGLSVLLRMGELADRKPPAGVLLRYATSLEPGRLPIDGKGLGVTNINTLRHWVGYAAIGYW